MPRRSLQAESVNRFCSLIEHSTGAQSFPKFVKEIIVCEIRQPKCQFDLLAHVVASTVAHILVFSVLDFDVHHEGEPASTAGLVFIWKPSAIWTMWIDAWVVVTTECGKLIEDLKTTVVFREKHLKPPVYWRAEKQSGRMNLLRWQFRINFLPGCPKCYVLRVLAPVQYDVNSWLQRGDKYVGLQC